MVTLLGYIATLTTMVSFLISDMFKLRVCNTFGCILWITYGIIKLDTPIILVNCLIMLIHLWWFVKHINEKNNTSQ
jgi:phosphotransferase system  glucose/maltose/N-acetylglucosamine-specific IIC component